MESTKIFTVCATGHRPNKLFGYNIDSIAYNDIRNRYGTFLERLCQTYGTIRAISGMALGIDTIFVQECEKLIEKGYDIRILCAIPCKNHSCKWSEKDRLWHANCIKKYETVFVSTEAYTPSCMQRRNEYMVDNSNLVLAFWDGTSGGTANCVHYAQKHNVPVRNLYNFRGFK